MNKKKRAFTPATHQVKVVDTSPKNTVYFLKYRDKLNIKVLSTALTVNNYQERFHHLLCWEEKEHMSVLAER